jgi:hypothetical protein
MNKLKKIQKILKWDNTLDLSVYDLYMLYKGYKRTDKDEYVKIKYRITKKMRGAILELAKIKHEGNKKFSEELINSAMFKLACVKAEREKKLKRVYIDGNNWYYKGKLGDVILYMGEIIQKANTGKVLQSDLRNYCRGEL